MSKNKREMLAEIPTTTPNVLLEVSFDYSEGGPNYAHGNMNPRGYTITAQRVEIQGGSRLYTFATGGMRRCVEVVKRFSQKKYDEVLALAKTPGTEIAKQIDELVAKVAIDQKLTLGHGLAQLGAAG